VPTLVSELVDSVSLTVRLDPEDMMHVIDVYLAACDDIIAQHDGSITQYAGGGADSNASWPAFRFDRPPPSGEARGHPGE
jgi:class 3 adenylate cyclase